MTKGLVILFTRELLAVGSDMGPMGPFLSGENKPDPEGSSRAAQTPNKVCADRTALPGQDVWPEAGAGSALGLGNDLTPIRDAN